MSAARARASYRCVGCRKTFPRGFDVCSCGLSNSCVRAIGREESERDAEGDPCVSLADYEAIPVTRLAVCEPWHSLLGPEDSKGLPISDEGTSGIAFGAKGTGKTSVMLKLAASVHGSVWVPVEQGMGPSMVKSYAARLGLPAFRVALPGTLEDMCDDLRARARPLVIVDSGSADCFANPIHAWHAFRDATPGAAFWMILHANKRGRMTGPEKLGHLCDTVVRFGQRISIHQKNRFGPPNSVPNPWYIRGRKDDDEETP